MIKDAIKKLIEKEDLTKKEAHATMKEIMSGQTTPSQIAGFLVALRNKGETPDEIAGCALAMREAATPIVHKSHAVVDNCGTGGDGQQSLNISTAASFVVSGAGFTVAKHGNRSVSSQCGSADVFEALGVRLDAPTAVIEQSLNEAGLAFLFAPHFHPAMKHAMPTRKELGIRTVFNMLGPLTNPARASIQLIGVYKPDLTRPMAKVLSQMGHKAGLVVHSKGWDEITLEHPTQVSELFQKKVRTYTLTAKDFGLPKVPLKALKGGDAQKNSAVLLSILEGKKIPARHVVVANAAALIWIAERALKNKRFKLKEAVRLAEQTLDSGAALKKCRHMAEISHSMD